MMTYWISSHTAHPHTCTGPSLPPSFPPPLHDCLEPMSTGTWSHLTLSLHPTIINCSLTSNVHALPPWFMCTCVCVVSPSLSLQGVYQHGHFSFSPGPDILSPCATDCRLPGEVLGPASLSHSTVCAPSEGGGPRGTVWVGVGGAGRCVDVVGVRHG